MKWEPTFAHRKQNPCYAFSFTLLLVAAGHFCLAQTPNSDIYHLHIRKATGAIQLDGELDEPDWKAAQAAGRLN